VRAPTFTKLLPFFRDKSYYNTCTAFIILRDTPYFIGKDKLTVSSVDWPPTGEEAVSSLFGFDISLDHSDMQDSSRFNL
jgi:hypothetical protein